MGPVQGHQQIFQHLIQLILRYMFLRIGERRTHRRTQLGDKRYREFLTFCEERRAEGILRIEEDEARKQRKKEKEDTWSLMRLTINFLKENEER